MRSFVRAGVVAAASICALALPGVAEAKVHINIDLDKQVMHVTSDTGEGFDTKISSGKPGYDSPAGSFGVLWMDKEHHSDTYDDAYMPDAIFFAPGYAIHGFGKSPWGHKASHGCIRTPMAKAAELFAMVKAQGADITITGQSPVTLASIRAKLQERDAANAPTNIAPAAPRYADAQNAPANANYPAGYAAPQYADEAQAGYDEGYAAPPPPRPAPGPMSSLFGGFY